MSRNVLKLDIQIERNTEEEKVSVMEQIAFFLINLSNYCTAFECDLSLYFSRETLIGMAPNERQAREDISRLLDNSFLEEAELGKLHLTARGARYIAEHF